MSLLVLFATTFGCSPALWLRAPRLPTIPLVHDPQVANRLRVLVPSKDGKRKVEAHGWHRRGKPLQYRWRHDQLEALLDSPLRDRLATAMSDKSNHVQATAAIGLARIHPDRYGNELERIVRTTKNKPPVRCAAAEMLGFNKRSGRARLARLLDTLWRFDGEELPPNYQRMLHGQLLRSYGRFVSPGEDRRFEQVWEIPLPGQSEGLPHARLALVESWENAGDSIDGQVMDLLESSNQQLRMAVLRLIGRTGNREFVTEVSRALDDRNHQVAATAALALGKLKDETSALVHLRDKAKRGPLPVRVAAVKGLASQHDWSTVTQYANDSDWKIRHAVATSLSNMPKAEATRLASRLIEDRSMEVAKEVITATKGWPLQQSAPILFAALERDTFLIRKMAARTLGAKWPAARRFPRGASKRNRKSALARLRKKWQSEYGDLTPAKDNPSSKSKGNASLTPLDREHENELVQQLVDAESASEQQSTLNQLARLLENHTAKHQTAIEVQRSVQDEKAPAMWTAALKCLSGQPWLAVARSISRAQRHRSPEVRIAAINLLGLYSKQAPEEVWDSSILDRDQKVVIVTLAAMRKHGIPKSQLRVVKSLTQSTERETRVAAASCLAKHGDLSGAAALDRFALDDDPRMKRLAAQYLGLIGGHDQVPTLIDMLDDESSVSLIALDSLTQIVGDKSPNFAGDTQSQRIRRWKRWYRKKTREPSDSEVNR